MCASSAIVAGRVFPSNFKWLVGQTDCLPCSGAAAAAAHVPLIRMNRSRAQWEDYKKTTQHRIKSIGPLLLPLFFEWNPVRRRQQTRQTAGRSDHYYKTIYSHTHLCSHRSKVMATEEGTNERPLDGGVGGGGGGYPYSLVLGHCCFKWFCYGLTIGLFAVH